MRNKIWIGIAVLVVVAMGFGTKVVDGNEATAAGVQKFDPATYGATEFPKIQAALEERAAPAAELAAALKKDKAAAEKQYGVPSSTGAEMATSFTGTVGKIDGGIATVDVEGLPSGLVVRVQVGPAINGTDLRDSTGTVTFGQFTNQIEYQDAASALNEEMKKQVLAPLGDAKALTGRKLTVVGVFPLINPNGWLVTPAKASKG